MKLKPSTHASSFTFAKLGDSLHLQIADYRDLQEILELDEALWIATTAPISNLKTDCVFLELLDTDSDGRLRAEEVKDGIRFLHAHHNDHSAIKADHFDLLLAHINTDSERGRLILDSAEKVLKRLGAEPDTIHLEQVRTVQGDVLKGGLDEAGIVLPEATEDDKIKNCIKDILATVGGNEHPSGKIGVTQDTLNEFLAQCRIYLGWRLEAGDISGDNSSDILPLGSKTQHAYNLFQDLAKKLTQYFLLCDVKRLNPELIVQAVREPEANIALNLMQIDQAETYLADAPLSLLNADGILDLAAEMNPYFREQIKDLTDQVIKPLLGPDTNAIDKQSFRQLQKVFAPYLAWTGRKPQVVVDKLPDEVIQAYQDDPLYREAIQRLIEESHRTAFVLENLRELERLILYQALLLPLVNSFVSFPTLYDLNSRALFEEGTLIMDGRHFTFAIRVDDRERHIETVRNSNIFVMYCELYADDGEVKYEIAVPVTSGTRGTLHINKWGIFNDIDGCEQHAKIIDIVENPISLGEAVIDPFIRLHRSFFSRLERFSSKAEERLFQLEEKKDTDKKKKDNDSAGLLAGGGVAVAAVGSSFAFMVKTLSSLTLKTVILALLIVAGIVAVPAAIVAYYKLSRRDLSTILEGSGWGMNSRMRLTGSQATNFSFKPSRPSSLTKSPAHSD